MADDQLEAVIGDAEIVRVHGYANFGPEITPRQVVNDGVRKYAVGYQGGHTQLCILMEHGLITKPRPGKYDANLTQKGKRYAQALYQIDQARLRASEAATAAAVERAERAEYALTECRPFIERYSDFRDGDYGGVEPNEAMQLVHAIDQALPSAPPVAEEKP